MSPSSSEYPEVRRAAAVILVRERPGSGAVEVFLIQRHHRTKFMSSAYVFPGGAADEDESDLRVSAARELFEEAGVLIARAPVDAATRSAWRDHLNRHEPMPPEMRAAFHRVLDLDAMHYYAHWITPSIVPKRFSATFYVAVMGADEEPAIDNREAVDATWVTPAEALARARDLHLHPPQLRTLMDMREAAEMGIDALLAEAAERAAQPHAILPRQALIDDRMHLLLPWDPDYMSAGRGEAMPLPADHPLAVGPSRFVLEDRSWNHIPASAPDSPNAV